MGSVPVGCDEQVAKFLVKAGAEVNWERWMKDEDGDKYFINPLYSAVRLGHTDLARWLIEAGAIVPEGTPLYVTSFDPPKLVSYNHSETK